jgi:hypothetical protein
VVDRMAMNWGGIESDVSLIDYMGLNVGLDEGVFRPHLNQHGCNI